MEREPRPATGTVLFEEADFRALSPTYAPNPEYNGPRLGARRKLLALGKDAARRAAALGHELDCRTSLHHPHAFNGMRVRRIWAYLTRPKKERRRLQRILGPELGADLDAAFRNAYLCLALESEALEVGLRIHADAWYDGQNLKNRVAAEGLRPLLSVLNDLEGFRLRLDDWKGEWPCGGLEPEALEEFLGYYRPGEHLFAVERRFPAPEGNRGPALEQGAAEALVDELLRLVPLLAFAAWSAESDHLFPG